MPPRGRDDASIAQEQIGHLDRLVEKTARVTAQIEHDTGGWTLRIAAEAAAKFAFERGGGVLVERGDTHSEHVAVAPGDDGRWHHMCACHGDVERRIDALALDGKPDLAAVRAAQPPDDLVLNQVFNWLAVDLGDDVVRF